MMWAGNQMDRGASSACGATRQPGQGVWAAQQREHASPVYRMPAVHPSNKVVLLPVPGRPDIALTATDIDTLTRKPGRGAGFSREGVVAAPGLGPVGVECAGARLALSSLSDDEIPALSLEEHANAGKIFEKLVSLRNSGQRFCELDTNTFNWVS